MQARYYAIFHEMPGYGPRGELVYVVKGRRRLFALLREEVETGWYWCKRKQSLAMCAVCGGVYRANANGSERLIVRIVSREEAKELRRYD